MKFFIKQYWPIIAILLLAFFLRLWAVLMVGDFTWDEMFSFTYSQKPWLDSLKFWTWETNPPLHLLILKIWFYIFPANEFWQRLPSLIFGLATVFYVYKIGRAYFNKKTGLITAALLALHPYHIFLSTFGRGYALLLLLASVSFYYCLEIFYRGNQTRKNLIILALVNLAFAYTHLTAFLVLAAETAIILMVNSKSFLLWLKIHAIPTVLWLVWTIPAFAAKMNGSETLGSAWFFNFSSGFTQILTPLKLIFLGPANDIFLYCIIGAWSFFWIWRIVSDCRKKTINYCYFSAGFIFFIILAAGLILHLWNVRFLVVSLPFVITIFAVLLDIYIKRTWLIVCAVLLLCLPGLIQLKNIFPVNDWGKLNTYISDNSTPGKKQVFVYNDFIEKLLVDRYYKGPAEEKMYLPQTTKDWDRLIITENYRRYLHSAEEMKTWYEANLKNYDEIFFLYSQDVGIDLREIFLKDGRDLISVDNISPAKDARKIYRYAKNSDAT